MQDHRDRRARARPRIETAFEAPLGAGKYDFGQGRRSHYRKGKAPSLERGGRPAYISGARARAILETAPLETAPPVQRIYLDHAATTPMLPEAKAALCESLDRWANPSSPHREGRAARAALEEARARIKAALGWRHELIFTSGATEAAALALGRARGSPAAIVSAVEHQAVMRQRPDAAIAPVGRDGLVDEDALAGLLADRPGAIVAIQHVNSETGVLQPIGALVEAIDAAGGLLFADCAQSAGKLPLPQADLIAVSAHKLGGPPGIGALLVRDLSMLEAMGAGQEQGYRAGTENLPAILAFAAAAEVCAIDGGVPGWMLDRYRWRVALDAQVRAVGAIVCDGSLRSAAIASYRMPGMSAAAQLMRLDAIGFAVSAGSACSSGSLKPSHVLSAIGLDPREAGEVLRVSFGHATREEEVQRFGVAWSALAREAAGRAA